MVLAPDVDAATGRVTVTVAARVMLGATVVGVVGLDLDVEELQAVTQGPSPVFDSGYGVVANGAGGALSYPTVQQRRTGLPLPELLNAKARAVGDQRSTTHH